jgi:two-component system, OmpR family, sensor histidine kinase VicK
LQAEHYGTRTIEKSEQIIEEITQWILTSNELSVSVTSGGMQFSYDYFFQTKKKVLDKYRRGEHKGVRFITFIDNDNIDAVKNYLDAGAKIKHVKNLPPMSLGISDKQALTTLEKMEDGKVVQSLLVSNDVSYIKYFAGIFDELWDSGIDATERIKDIEEGRETHDELADAKQYLNLVLEEVNKMKNKAEQQWQPATQG